MDENNVIDFFILLVTIGGFVATIITIKKGRKDLKIANAIELKKLLNDYKSINYKLFPNGDWNKSDFDFDSITDEEFSDFNNYLGYFEIAKFMIDNKSMSKKEFEVFFLYRLHNINDCESVMKHIRDPQNINNWINLIALMKQFDLSIGNLK